MPSSKTTEYLFAYDVTDNRERRKVEKLLHNYGFRRQYSVFICRLTRSGKSRLMRELNALMLQTGFVLIARLAHNCHTETVGATAPADPDQNYAFIL
jgi:CRISPR-associated endonuclease Cas2